jgi:hypothetical protein
MFIFLILSIIKKRFSVKLHCVRGKALVLEPEHSRRTFTLEAPPGIEKSDMILEESELAKPCDMALLASWILVRI